MAQSAVGVSFPRWREVEESETFKGLDFTQKKRVLDSWTKDYKDLGTKEGWWNKNADDDKITSQKRREVIGRNAQFDLDNLQVAADFITEKEPGLIQRGLEVSGASPRFGGGTEALGQPARLVRGLTDPFDKYNPVARKDRDSTFWEKADAFLNKPDVAKEKANSVAEQDYVRRVNAIQDPDERKAFIDQASELSKLSRKQKDAIVISGNILVHPDNHLDPNKFQEAVRSAEGATDAQKQAALESFPQFREASGERQAQILREYDEGFRKYEAEEGRGKSDADKVAGYKEQVGTLGALATDVGTALVSRLYRAALQPLVGAYAGGMAKAAEVTGSETLQKAAEGGAEYAASLSQGMQKAAEYSQVLGAPSLPLPGGASVSAGDVIEGAGSLAPVLAAGFATRGVGTRAVTAIAGRQIAGAALSATEKQARMAVLTRAFRPALDQATFGATIATAGVQSYGGTFIDAYESFYEKNVQRGQGLMTDQEMRENAMARAQSPAVAAGLATAVITAAFGKTGVEAVLFATKTPGFKAGLKSILKEAGYEAVEEGTDQLVQGLQSTASYRPEATLGEIITESIKAATIGGILGGGVNAIRIGANKVTSSVLNRTADEADRSSSPETAGALRDLSGKLNRPENNESDEEVWEATQKAADEAATNAALGESKTETKLTEQPPAQPESGTKIVEPSPLPEPKQEPLPDQSPLPEPKREPLPDQSPLPEPKQEPLPDQSPLPEPKREPLPDQSPLPEPKPVELLSQGKKVEGVTAAEVSEAVVNSETAQEFEAWAKEKKIDAIKPPEGGRIAPSIYWEQTKQQQPEPLPESKQEPLPDQPPLPESKQEPLPDQPPLPESKQEPLPDQPPLPESKQEPLPDQPPLPESKQELPQIPEQKIKEYDEKLASLQNEPDTTRSEVRTIANQMLKDGLVTDEEFKAIDSAVKDKSVTREEAVAAGLEELSNVFTAKTQALEEAKAQEPPAKPEPINIEDPEVSVKRGKSFTEDGEYDVKIGDQNFRIYKDQNTGWWFDAEAQKEGLRKGGQAAYGNPGLLSTETRADALEKLVEQWKDSQAEKALNEDPLPTNEQPKEKLPASEKPLEPAKSELPTFSPELETKINAFLEDGTLVRNKDGTIEVPEAKIEEMAGTEDLKQAAKTALEYNDKLAESGFQPTVELDETFEKATDGLTEEKRLRVEERVNAFVEEQKQREGNQTGEGQPDITFPQILSGLVAQAVGSKNGVALILEQNKGLTEEDKQDIASKTFVEIASSEAFDPTKKKFGTEFVSRFEKRLLDFVTRDPEFKARNTRLDEEGAPVLTDDANKKDATPTKEEAQAERKVITDSKIEARAILNKEIEDLSPEEKLATELLLSRITKLRPLVADNQGGASTNKQPASTATKKAAETLLATEEGRARVRDRIETAIAKASLVNKTTPLTRDLVTKTAESLIQKGVNKQGTIASVAVDVGLPVNTIRKIKTFLMGNDFFRSDDGPKRTAGLRATKDGTGKSEFGDAIDFNLGLIREGRADNFLGVGSEIPAPITSADRGTGVKVEGRRGRIAWVTADEVQQAKDFLKSKTSRLGIVAQGPNAEDYKALTTIGVGLIQDGLNNVADFTEALVKAVGEYVRTYAKDVFERSRSAMASWEEAGSPKMGVNINDEVQDFTGEILRGEKTIETRDSRSLDSKIGQRIGIVRTGKGKATLVGYATVGEPVEYKSEADFRSDEGKHRVAAGSKRDIASNKTGVKYGYPLTNVVMSEPMETPNEGRVFRKLPMAPAPKDPKATKFDAASVSDEEVKSRTVPGRTVGTSNPTAVKATTKGTDSSNNVELERLKEGNPETYRKNAFLLARYPIVARTERALAKAMQKLDAPLQKADANLKDAVNKLERIKTELTAAVAEFADKKVGKTKQKDVAAALTTISSKDTGAIKLAPIESKILGIQKRVQAQQKVTDDLRATRKQVFKNTSKAIEDYAKSSNFTLKDAERLYDTLKRETKSNLELLMNLFPKEIRRVAKLWYDGANIIAQDFGKQFDQTLEKASAVLAVFSPQKDWFMNVALAKRTMNIWKNHQNTKWSPEMSRNYLRRAGEPQQKVDKFGEDVFDDEGNPVYEKGAVFLGVDENGFNQWGNWDPRESVEEAKTMLKFLEGKSLKNLAIVQQKLDKKGNPVLDDNGEPVTFINRRWQARFIRMFSEVNDDPKFPIVSPDGNFGENSRTEKGKEISLAWGGYGTIEKAVRIMEARPESEADTISQELGEQHKVRSFYDNIVNPASTDGHVTMDTHAIAALLWMPLSGASTEVTQNFGGAGTSSDTTLGLKGLYAAFAEAYREAGKELGLLPREVQSITWEAVRILFTAEWKRGKDKTTKKSNVDAVREIWDKYKNDDNYTIEQARRDIFQLAKGRDLESAVTDAAKKDGEGVGRPNWADVGNRNDNSGRPQETDDAGKLPEDGGNQDGTGRRSGQRGDAGGTTGVVRESAKGRKSGTVLAAPAPQDPASKQYREDAMSEKEAVETAIDAVENQILGDLNVNAKVINDDSGHPAYAQLNKDGTLTILLNKKALAELAKIRSKAEAKAVIDKIVDEEIDHIAAIQAIGVEGLREMGAAMSDAEREAVARKYISPRGKTAEEYEAEVKKMAGTAEGMTADQVSDAHYIIAIEQLRQIGQKVASGVTTEEIYEHASDKPFINRVFNYLAALASRIAAKLETAWNADLAEKLRRIQQARAELAGLPAVTQEMVEELRDAGVVETAAKSLLKLDSARPITGPSTSPERATSRSLRRGLLAQIDDIARILRETTYLKDNQDENARVADGYVRTLVDAGYDLEEIVEKLKGTSEPEGLTAVQFILAKAEVAQKLYEARITLDAETAKTGDLSKIPLSRYLGNLRLDIMSDLQKIGTLYGQGLVTFKQVNDMLDPYTVVNAVNGSLAKLHKNTIGTDLEMQGLFAQIQAALNTGAEAALGEVGDLVTKLLIKNVQGTVTQKKLMLGVINAMMKIYGHKKTFSGDTASKALPVMDRYIDELAQQISNLLLKDASTAVQGPALEILAKEIHSIVQSTIKTEMNAVAKEEAEEGLSEEELAKRALKAKNEKIQKMLSGLSQKILTRDYAEKAMDQARAAILRDLKGGKKGLSDRQVEALNALRLGDVLEESGLDRLVADTFTMREEIQKFVVDRDASKEMLVNYLLNRFKVSEEVAQPISDAIRLAYERESKKALKAAIDSAIKSASTPKIAKIAESQLDKLLKLSNMGAFSDEAFYNAVAESYGLPTFDEEFARMAEKEANRIQTMPKGSDARFEAGRNLLAKIAQFHLDTLKKHDKAAWNRFYYMEVPVAAWQAGVLSGIPTQAINTTMSGVSVLVKSLSTATGYAAADPSNAFRYYGDVLAGVLTMYSQIDGGGPNTFKLAWKKGLATGSTRFRNESKEQLSALETLDYKKTPWPLLPFVVGRKWVGRIMVAADAGNAVVANEVSQRMMLRYAMSTGKIKNDEALLKSLMDPPKSVVETIRQQAEAEAKKGLFDPSDIDLRGLSPDAKKARIQQLRKIGTDNRVIELLEARRAELLPDMVAISRLQAERWTFNSQAKGILGQFLSGALGGLGAKNPYAKFFFSFLNTMANIFNMALDFSPIGVARAFNLSPSSFSSPNNIYRWDVDEKTGNKRPIERGSPEFYEKLLFGTFGTAVGLLLYGMVEAGFGDEEKGEEPFFEVTAGGPVAKERRDVLQKAGWQPNTFKIGRGKSAIRIRYTDLPAINLIFSALGTISDVRRYTPNKDEKSTFEMAKLMGVGVANALTSKNMFQGAANLFRFISSPDQGIIIGAAESMTSGIVGGFSNPSLFRWMRSTFDVDKDGMVPRLDLGTTEGWLYSMVPFSIGYSEPAIDIFGDDIKDYPWAPTTRRFGVLELRPPNPVAEKLVTAKEGPLWVSGPSKNSRISVENRAGDVVQMTVGKNEDVFRAFSRYRGQFIKERLTESVAQQLVDLSQSSQEEAQAYLIKMGAKATDHAKRRVQQDVGSGKFKIDL